jgi:hypothetical protein
VAQRGFAPVPLAFIVRILPPLYGTVWLGGSTYYRAAGAYYLWSPLDEEYVVVAPPSGIQFAVYNGVLGRRCAGQLPAERISGWTRAKGFPRIETHLEHWTSISIDRPDNHHERHRDI